MIRFDCVDTEVPFRTGKRWIWKASNCGEKHRIVVRWWPMPPKNETHGLRIIRKQCRRIWLMPLSPLPLPKLKRLPSLVRGERSLLCSIGRITGKAGISILFGRDIQTGNHIQSVCTFALQPPIVHTPLITSKANE